MGATKHPDGPAPRHSCDDGKSVCASVTASAHPPVRPEMLVTRRKNRCPPVMLYHDLPSYRTMFPCSLPTYTSLRERTHSPSWKMPWYSGRFDPGCCSATVGTWLRRSRKSSEPDTVAHWVQ